MENFAPWIKEPIEASEYFLWSCGNRYEIIIVQYKDKLGLWFVEYSDCWSLKNCERYPVVSIKCRSLHCAKLMGDKVAKECEAWLQKPIKLPFG
jgi:hypothetical protein